jgi:hypothetical protein
MVEATQMRSRAARLMASGVVQSSLGTGHANSKDTGSAGGLPGEATDRPSAAAESARDKMPLTDLNRAKQP